MARHLVTLNTTDVEVLESLMSKRQQTMRIVKRAPGLLALPYDVRNRVVCFDKRPCFLISDLIEPLATQSYQ